MSKQNNMSWKLEELENVLARTFDDRRLSRNERVPLTEIVAQLQDKPDLLRFFRNRAFDLARDELSGIEQRNVLDWLEDVVKVIDRRSDRSLPNRNDVYFSPIGITKI